MNIKDLNRLLIEAYSKKNLDNISVVLINLYKSKQYSVLQKISEIIDEYVDISITDDGKGFSKFMMLYHPDRAGYHINEINRLTDQDNFDGLLEYSHILKLERIEEVASAIYSLDDLDYSPVYEWDLETEGFSITNDSQPLNVVKIKTKTSPIGYTFYDAIKIREYGHTDIEYPSFYLEDIEEFELSSSDINNLDGIEFCYHAKTIDLSSNTISDLTPLSGLIDLEELNISENEIGYIDVLSNLTNLRSLNLSYNTIEDISPLFELKKLDWVNLEGNRIDDKQIIKLTESGVVVEY